MIAELERVERLKAGQNWNALLASLGLPVLSSREIGTVRVSDHPFLLTKVVCYRTDPVTFRKYRHGETVGWGYLAEHKPRCTHRQLISVEWEPLVFTRCPDCGQFLSSGEVVSIRAVEMIRANKGLWKDKKHTPIRWSVEEDEGGEFLEYRQEKGTDVRFPRRYRRLLRFDRSEGWTARVAPEIDQRRLNAAWPYVLSHPDFHEYRAPYQKVRELRDGGFSIDQMARKLKVSPRTINSRLADVPDAIPRRDALALRGKAGGGYFRQRWPGADIPRGNRGTAPSEPARPTEWTWLPVQREPVTVTRTRAIEKRRAEIDGAQYEDWLTSRNKRDRQGYQRFLYVSGQIP